MFKHSTSESRESPKEEANSQQTQQTVNKLTSSAGPEAEPSTKPRKTFTAARTSKFRHLHGTPMHKSNNIDNVRNLSISVLADSDGFQVNQKFAAFPLSGPGGQIAVVPVSNPSNMHLYLSKPTFFMNLIAVNSFAWGRLWLQMSCHQDAIEGKPLTVFEPIL